MSGGKVKVCCLGIAFVCCFSCVSSICVVVDSTHVGLNSNCDDQFVIFEFKDILKGCLAYQLFVHWVQCLGLGLDIISVGRQDSPDGFLYASKFQRSDCTGRQ